MMNSEIAIVDPRAPLTFEWDERRERAAILVAQGELGITEIARLCGIDRDTLWTWRKSPIFNARIAQCTEAFRDEMLRVGIAAKTARIASLQDRHLRLQRIIEERAAAAMADPEARDIPGASSGLLMKQQKVSGSGRNAVLLEEWVFDSALMREMRSIEEHVARELGQWQPEAGNNVAIKLYAGIDIDAV